MKLVNNTKSSATTQMFVDILSLAVNLYKKLHFKRLAMNAWPQKSLKVIGSCAFW